MGETAVPVWLGTAGYAWPDWVGPFYPTGTSMSRMPAFYATQFPFVEINSTFYRTPTPGQLTRLANRTARGFQFALKVPRTASHEKSVHDIRPFREAADELAARHALVGFLLQFPEAFRDTAANRRWIDRVATGLRPYTTWVEFRHHSWNRPRLGDWLRNRGLEMVAVDVPDLPQLFPRGVLDAGSRRIYVRLHSRAAEKWTHHGAARYDYDYSDDALREWLGLMNPLSRDLIDVHFIFNNCHRIQGVQNARRIAEIIQAEFPAFRVIEPPAPPQPIQGTLFEELVS